MSTGAASDPATKAASGRPLASSPCAMVMAGGTGGHIFPGLAVAEALRERGWRVHWFGGKGTAQRPSMESQLVPSRGLPFDSISFGGLRGKGLLTMALLPVRLLKAFWQSLALVRRIRPDVVIGLGGYVTFPGGMMSVLLGKPLVLHEQNSVAGLANRVLCEVADRVFTAFPGVLKKAQWVGNPLRAGFLSQPAPAERFAGRQGPLRLLVVGGSLGAKALNEQVPQALALLPAAQRPHVIHQSGAGQLDGLRAHYQAAGVQADLTPFIEDTAAAFAQADLIICRAGASTVTEIAAVGAAAVFVPFPFAVDDHQSRNAQYLVDAGGGWLMPQQTLSAATLAELLAGLDRAELLKRATAAKQLEKTQATQTMVQACEELLA